MYLVLAYRCDLLQDTSVLNHELIQTQTALTELAKKQKQKQNHKIRKKKKAFRNVELVIWNSFWETERYAWV